MAFAIRQKQMVDCSMPSGFKTTPEQQHDSEKTGDDHLQYFITYYNPKQASTSAPLRKNRLLTIAKQKR